MTPEFEKVLSWGGSPQATCSCGRVHYTSGGDFMEPGELAGLEAQRKEKPDRYIPTGDDSVSITTFNGMPYVWECPCGALAKIEELFWTHRAQIIAYYQARTQRELKEATDNAAALAGVSNPRD
jgi:hypothetical protein